MIHIQSNFSKIIHNKISTHFKDYYDGKIKCPCNEECPEGCNGNHNYELPTKYTKLFKKS